MIHLVRPDDHGMANLNTLIRRHTEYLRHRNLRPSTIYQRRRTLIRLANDAAPAHLLDLDGDQLEALLLRRGTQPESRATDISHLHGFYRWAVMMGHLDRDPSAALQRPKLPRRLPRPIPGDDLAHALEAAPTEIRLICLLAALAGLRACEIAQLRGEHFTLHADPPLMVVLESKGGGMSSVPIHPHLSDALQRAPRCGPLITRRDGLPGHVRPWTVSQRANTFLHSEGITSTLHQLRHWFGTSLYQTSDRDLRVTQEGMRHRTPVSTALYTWIDPGAITEAIRAIQLPESEPPAAPRAA